MPLARHRVRLAAAACAGALIVVAGTPAAADRGTTRSGLRAQRAALGARARAALYALYAQDARIARARAAESRQAARVALVEREVQTVGGEVRVARHNLQAARAQLRARLLELYKAGALDPVEVVLASHSLQDALSRADTLQQLAQGDGDLIGQARRGRDELSAALRSLGAAQRQAESERAALAEQVQQLVSDRQAKAALLDRLRRERASVSTRIAQLDRLARAATRRAQRLATEAAGAEQPAPPAGTTPSPVPQPDPGQPQPGGSLIVSATAYSLGGTTATGLPTGPGICATDPNVIPLGTSFFVPGYGECLAADTGSAIVGDTIDLWMPEARALAWGRRTVTIQLR